MAVQSLMAAIDKHVQGFFVEALQLDEFTLQLEASDTATALSQAESASNMNSEK